MLWVSILKNCRRELNLFQKCQSEFSCKSRQFIVSWHVKSHPTYLKIPGMNNFVNLGFLRALYLEGYCCKLYRVLYVGKHLISINLDLGNGYYEKQIICFNLSRDSLFLSWTQNFKNLSSSHLNQTQITQNYSEDIFVKRVSYMFDKNFTGPTCKNMWTKNLKAHYIHKEELTSNRK